MLVGLVTSDDDGDDGEWCRPQGCCYSCCLAFLVMDNDFSLCFDSIIFLIFSFPKFEGVRFNVPV